jgi:hypothetical protein
MAETPWPARYAVRFPLRISVEGTLSRMGVSRGSLSPSKLTKKALQHNEWVTGAVKAGIEAASPRLVG